MIRSFARSSLSIISILLFALMQTALVSAPAFAHVDSAVSPGRTAPDRTLASIVQIQGTLSCERDGSGSTCNLQIQDSKTGQKFNLRRTAALTEILLSGTKTIAVKGTLQNGNIDVTEIKTL